MNRNESYSSSKRKRKRNDRQVHTESRVYEERRNYRDSRDFKRGIVKGESRQGGIQRKIQRLLRNFDEKNEIELQKFRANVKICEICGKPLSVGDIASALPNRETGNPAHFDCILKSVCEREKTNKNERIAYIGQGKFAVLRFPNPKDSRNFKILRVIEWESSERQNWREEIAGLFSLVR